MVEFAGYDMPVQYASGILAEHTAVRTACGAFDVSHMGRLDLTGPETFAALQKLATNDLGKLVDGQVQYNHFCKEDGGILDDLLISRWDQNRWNIVCNASNRPKIVGWLQKHLPGGVKLTDNTDDTFMVAVQGPKARDLLQPLLTGDLASIKYYRFIPGKFSGTDVVISRTGYTGEDGFEVIGPAKLAEEFWNKAVTAGASPCGLGARDTLRLEAGMPLYGHELDEQTNPLEAVLDWVVKLEKGEFIGRDAIRATKEKGYKKKLVSFEVPEKGAIPRQGYKLFAGGREIGIVTSGVLSPTLQKNIGMGYVPADHASPGSQFEVEIRGRKASANAVALPFYKRAK